MSVTISRGAVGSITGSPPVPLNRTTCSQSVMLCSSEGRFLSNHFSFTTCNRLSGFAEVEERKRWREILDSLCHYSYSLDSIKRVYMDHLQQYENRLRKDERTVQVIQI
jgi:hypothetical protein